MTSVQPTDDPAALQARVAELEATQAELQGSQRVQSALYRIAETASAAHDMQEFYAAVHGIVGELMYAENMYIVLFDEERQQMNWPFAVDEVDDSWPDPNVWEPMDTGQSRGVTAYMLRQGTPLLLATADWESLIAAGEIEMLGPPSVDWLGVPLRADGRIVGAMVVQSYREETRHEEQDKELLTFVGTHVGAALSRARAIEETRQRNAELAVINDVQGGLAENLDMQAMYDLVGDRIRDIFDAQVVDIGIVEGSREEIWIPYSIERGVRFPEERIPVLGFRKHVLETQEPLLINEGTLEQLEAFAQPVDLLAGEMARSILFVPLVLSGRSTGVISLQNLDREHAFSDADVRLLSTIAGSLSVALENARLIEETRQRNAELTLINDIQHGLAENLEMQAMYDLVGDRIQQIFDAQTVDIGVVDHDAGSIWFPYSLERGVRLIDHPIEIMGFRRIALETREPVVVNEDMERRCAEAGNPLAIAGEPSLSSVFVPLMVGNRGTGVFSLHNLDREHAFSDADVRLLTTIAGSLSVALENARLFEETRQRNAELALINDVQLGLVENLDAQAMYDLVGDRIQGIFDSQVVDIGILDASSGLVHFPYVIERGVRLQEDPIELIGQRRIAIETRQPVLINEDLVAKSAEVGQPPVLSGEVPKAAVFVPLLVGDRAIGLISLQDLDREHAFSDGDVRLLMTLAGSLSVALENARLFEETRQNAAEMSVVNDIGQALADQLDFDALVERLGDQLREVFGADIVYVALLDEPSNMIEFKYHSENGVREPQAPLPFGEGLTSEIIQSRGPLLLNRDEAFQERGQAMIGTPVRSYLGVPILTGADAIGVISVQSTGRAGLYGEDETRLLATIAANVGVAIQNARLFADAQEARAVAEQANAAKSAFLAATSHEIRT
ncbi:MAG: GAF domain-containing protein, partial [Actinomycetota bacterium]